MAEIVDDSTNNGSVPSVSSPSLRFAGVQLFFFRRKQGFNCVPSKGGTTLGMAERHFDEHRVSFDGEEEIELEVGESSNNLSFDGSNDDGEEDSPSRKLRKRPNSPFQNAFVPDKSSLAELRPLPVRQRRRLLRLSGVKKIDTTERFECEAIRLSRNECGCQSCGSVCMPDTCPCSLNGIACQVDKMAYPCSCSREGCHNVEGRIEFNAVRVRQHLIHTLTKLYAAGESNGGGSSEDSGAVDDDFPIVDDNCDDYGRCRHCNLHEPAVITLKHQLTVQAPPEIDEISTDAPHLDEEEEIIANSGQSNAHSSSSRQTSAAIVATKMLRRKLARHWRQKASIKTGSDRLVSKLVLMRRAMSSSTAPIANSSDLCH